MFQGSIVALVTPFSNGKVDEKKLEELVEFHISNGTDAIVPCGTTGESPTLNHDEDIFVTKRVVDIVNKRVPVIAGTGSNNFEEALSLTKAAKENGADGCLVVTPYYNRPTQEGLYQHYKKLAESVNLPMVMYNVPTRTGVDLQPDTVVRLSKVSNIVAVKEATGNVANAMKILAMAPDFTVLSGDDSMTVPMMSIGAKGLISVVANIVPKEMHQMTSAALKGDFAEAKRLHYKYFKLIQAMGYETNPIPVKTALHLMGMITEEIRLPLVQMSEGAKAKLTEVMKEYKLI